MRKMLFAAVVATAAAVAGVAVAADLKSGPQTGATVPGPFHPLNCTGDNAGKKACLYCKHGTNPVAVIFARNPDCPMTQALIQKLDAATAENKKQEMGSFAVFLTDDDKAADKLKEMGTKAGLKELVLAVDNPSGPTKYEIAKDADVTVILYTDHTVKANHAFKKGELTEAGIDAVVKDVAKIAPAK